MRLKNKYTLKNEIYNSHWNTKRKNLIKKKKKYWLINADRLIKEKQKILNVFERKIFPTGKETQGKGIKILTPKQMLQRSPIALAQVKASNTSENLLNENCQIISQILCIEEKKLLKKCITI